MATDNLNVLRGTAQADAPARGGPEGITRRVDEAVRIGRAGARSGRMKLFHYDRFQGARGATLKAEVDQADRMSDTLAAEKLQRIHEAFGLLNEVEGILYDFDHAMFLCYALNGGSQIGPHERVQFRLARDGAVHAFEFKLVVEILGVDLRRFFRTMANDVVEACKHLYYNYDVHDDDQVEMQARMVKLASSRNLSRYPYLVADCCDAATNTSQVEYASVMASKAAVIGATSNAVDQMRAAVAIHSSDGYDSSLGKTVPVVGTDDIGPRYRR